VRRLMRALTSVGLFDEAEGRFGLNALSRQLLPNRPGSVVPVLRLASEDWVAALWRHLPDAVRSGKPAVERVLRMPLFEYLARHKAAGEVFDRAMLSMTAQTTGAVLEAYDLTGVRTLVDLGGGLGQFLMAALERYPQLRGTLFEAPRTAEAAAKQIAETGLGSRIEVSQGNFLDNPLPAGADVYLLMNVIHDWGDADAVRILTRVREALRPGARLLVVEMVLPESAGAPCMGAVLDLQMLLLFDGGRERTEAEFRSLFVDAGLRLGRVFRTASPACIMEVARA
jgi:SAM-dependent methyltransferase